MLRLDATLCATVYRQEPFWNRRLKVAIAIALFCHLVAFFLFTITPLYIPTPERRLPATQTLTSLAIETPWGLAPDWPFPEPLSEPNLPIVTLPQPSRTVQASGALTKRLLSSSTSSTLVGSFNVRVDDGTGTIIWYSPPLKEAAAPLATLRFTPNPSSWMSEGTVELLP